MPRFPFVLLDVGQTLIGPRRSYGTVYAEVLGTLGFEAAAADLDRAIRQAATELSAGLAPGFDRYRRFPGGEAAYWLRFVECVVRTACASDPDPDDLTRAADALREASRGAAEWRVFPEVPAVLDRLLRAGCRLAVVSNWDSRLPYVLGSLGLAPHFEVLAVSHLEGVEKPDPRLFERALLALDAHPERALHVGDVPELDLAGARAAGIEARLIDRTGALDDRYRAWPDLRPLLDEVLG